MALYFKDRVPDPLHGQNARFYDAVSADGTVRLSDFKLVLKNNIPAERQGDPLSAGNLNYASGNYVFPAGSPFDTHKGSVMTISSGMAVPAKTKRSIAANGPAGSSLSYGFHRLADDKIVVMYDNAIVPLTLSFTGRTAAQGAAFGGPGADNSLLVRGLDNGGKAQLCCLNADPRPGYGSHMYMYEITNAMAATQAPVWNFTPFTSATNMVRAGSSSVLFCASLLDNFTEQPLGCFAYIMTCGGGEITVTKSAAVPGLDAASGAMFRKTLFCIDQTNGRYLLIYDKSSQVCAMAITVTGSDIAFGTPQLLGSTSNTLYTASYAPGGDDYRADTGGIVILDGPAPAGYGPAKMQTLTVNAAGAAAPGPVQPLPVMYSGYNPGLTCLGRAKNGRLWLTGVDMDATPRDACLLELTAAKSGISPGGKYRPFRLPGTESDSLAAAYMKQAAYENPNVPGEFFFMQQSGGSALLWFGGWADCFDTQCVAGIAIDDVADGYVRVQTEGKLLTGIFGGLTPGEMYAAGDNGSLAACRNGGNKPVGVALSEHDLLFFGADSL